MKALLAALALLIGSQAHAGGAVEYNCLGKDAASGESVLLTLTFSEYDREVGYSNQSITILKKGWETLEKPIVFQMSGATKKNNCTINENGEIRLKTDINMTPTQNNKIAEYEITVKTDCKDAQFDISAQCSF
jgi:hypothetical protein